MRKELRLTRKKDFEAIRLARSSWSNELLVLVTRRNDREFSRFGFSVGRRVGGAVVRNRIKRRLREGTRSIPIWPGWDSVLIVRKPAALVGFNELNRSITSLFKRAGLIPSRVYDTPSGQEAK